MTNPEIFPVTNDGYSNAINDIAKFVGAESILVNHCISTSGEVEYDTPGHLDAVNGVTHSFNDAARHAKNLHRALTLMTPSQRKELIVAGCASMYQIEHLADVLTQDAKSLQDWSRSRIRTGGKNLAAYGMAKAMRHLFRRLRREVTFGQDQGGGPSTDFGKTVQFTIGAFGIKADWRRPAQHERDFQRQINERFHRVQGRRTKPILLKKPDEVTINFENEDETRTYVMSVEGRNDIPPHRVCACRFKSGEEVANYAAVWFAEIGANS